LSFQKSKGFVNGKRKASTRKNYRRRTRNQQNIENNKRAAISPYLTTITLNVKGLNSLLKRCGIEKLEKQSRIKNKIQSYAV
jgi:hypothetical protein